jgi:hypothetical protein
LAVQGTGKTMGKTGDMHVAVNVFTSAVSLTTCSRNEKVVCGLS